MVFLFLASVFWVSCVSEGLKVDSANLVELPGGTFTMGSASECPDETCGGDHHPHLVTLDPFTIQDRPVSRAAYGACIAAKACQTLPGLESARYRIERPNAPVEVNDPALGEAYCASKGMRLPTEAELELVARGGNMESLGTSNLASPEWAADGYRPDIGCADRLTLADSCPSQSCSCSDENCQDLCLPAPELGFYDGASLACAPGVSKVPDVNPKYNGSFGVVRGGSTCGFVRRHAARGGSFVAGFRCVTVGPQPQTPAVYRFRLLNCPSGANVDFSISDAFQLDVFDNGSFSSRGSSATGLPCDAVFALHAKGSVTLSATSTGTCRRSWFGSAELSSGDQPATGVAALSSAGETGTGCTTNNNDKCPGANLMTDANNCGACAHSCFGTQCISGECQPGLVATGQSGPFDISANLNGLYWTNRTGPNGSVWHCAIPNGSTFNCAPMTDLETRPGYLAFDGSLVYWPNYDGGQIRSCGLDGCSPSAATLDTPGGGPLGMTVENGQLIYTQNTGGAIQECTLPGCTSPHTLVMNQGVGPYGVAADSTYLFFTVNGVNGALKSCPRTGCGLFGNGTPTTLASPLENPGMILINAGFVYFYTSTSVERWDITNFLREKLADAVSPAGLAVDSTHLYWTNTGDGTIRFCQLADCKGTARVAASGQASPLGITAFGSGLFWANSGDGTIRGMAAPLDSP